VEQQHNQQQQHYQHHQQQHQQYYQLQQLNHQQQYVQPLPPYAAPTMGSPRLEAHYEQTLAGTSAHGTPTRDTEQSGVGARSGFAFAAAAAAASASDGDAASAGDAGSAEPAPSSRAGRRATFDAGSQAEINRLATGGATGGGNKSSSRLSKPSGSKGQKTKGKTKGKTNDDDFLHPNEPPVLGKTLPEVGMDMQENQLVATLFKQMQSHGAGAELGETTRDLDLALREYSTARTNTSAMRTHSLRDQVYSHKTRKTHMNGPLGGDSGSDEKKTLPDRLRAVDKSAKLRKSLFIFGPKCRMAMFRVSISRVFEWSVFAAIVLSIVMLIVENQYDVAQYWWWFMMDCILAAIFLWEAVTKIIAYGFISTEAAYMHDTWNVLDFIIVICAISNISATIALGNVGKITDNNDAAQKSLKVVVTLRALKVLRTLRLVRRLPGMRIVVAAFMSAFGPAIQVILLLLLLMGVFAILGAGIFGGQFDRCSDPLFEPKASLKGCVGSVNRTFYSKLSCYQIKVQQMELNDVLKSRWFVPNHEARRRNLGGERNRSRYEYNLGVGQSADELQPRLRSAGGLAANKSRHWREGRAQWGEWAAWVPEVFDYSSECGGYYGLSVGSGGLLAGRSAALKEAYGRAGLQATAKAMGRVDMQWGKWSETREQRARKHHAEYRHKRTEYREHRQPYVHEYLRDQQILHDAHIAHASKAAPERLHSVVNLYAASAVAAGVNWDIRDPEQHELDQRTRGANEWDADAFGASGAAGSAASTSTPLSVDVGRTLSVASKDMINVNSRCVFVTERRVLHSDLNFDNFHEAFYTLFVISTLDSWVDIMYQAIDGTGDGKQPAFNSNKYASLYFVVYVILGVYVTVNIIVGVICDHFQRQREGLQGAVFLTDKQKAWWDTQQLLNKQRRPIRLGIEPKTWPAKLFFQLNHSNQFDQLVYAMISLNMISMAMTYEGQSDNYSQWLEISNYYFVGFFVVEAWIKIMGSGWRLYISNSWNKFDFFVTATSCFEVMLKFIVDVLLHQGGEGSSGAMFAMARMMRLFRVSRMLRLLNWHGIESLLFALWMSLESLMHVGILLVLMLFIFSIVGTNLFSKAAMTGHGGLNADFNFNNFFNAMTTLYRVASGEKWGPVMQGCYDNVFTSKTLARVYFMFFIALVNFVMLKLFVAVLVEKFDMLQTSAETGQTCVFTSYELAIYLRTWSRLDPNGTGYITIDKLPQLLLDLGQPLGHEPNVGNTLGIDAVRKSNSKEESEMTKLTLKPKDRLAAMIASKWSGKSVEEEEAWRMVSALDMPIYSELVHYHELLYRLCKKTYGTDMPLDDLLSSIKEDTSMRRMSYRRRPSASMKSSGLKLKKQSGTSKAGVHPTGHIGVAEHSPHLRLMAQMVGTTKLHAAARVIQLAVRYCNSGKHLSENFALTSREKLWIGTLLSYIDSKHAKKDGNSSNRSASPDEGRGGGGGFAGLMAGISKVPVYKEGDRIEGNWLSHGSWFPAVVVSVNEDSQDQTKYSVRYDDGNLEDLLARQMRRPVQTLQGLTVPKRAAARAAPANKLADRQMSKIGGLFGQAGGISASNPKPSTSGGGKGGAKPTPNQRLLL
jgi:hypothetical protein